MLKYCRLALVAAFFTAAGASATSTLPEGYYFTTDTIGQPSTSAASAPMRTLDLNWDHTVESVRIGALDYRLFLDSKQAMVRGERFRYGRWWDSNGNYHDTTMEEYEAAFPGGKLTVPETVEYGGETYTVIAIEEFGNVKQLREIELPNTLLRIGNGCFQNSGLIRILIPDSVIELGYSVFQRCQNLEEIFIGQQVEEFYAGLFMECPSLRKIEIDPQNPHLMVSETYLLTKDGKNLFGGFNQTRETIDDIPESVETLLEGAFQGYPNLTSVKLNSSLKNIDAFAFADCPNLEYVDLPEGLLRIGGEYPDMWQSVFSGTKITELRLPDSLTSFNGAREMEFLEKFHIGKNLEYLGAGPNNTPWHNVLIDCPNITEVTIDPENKFWKVIGKSVYNKIGNVLAFNFDKGSLSMPIEESVIWICNSAFCYLDLKSITLPPHTWRVDGFVFEGTNLTEPVTFPASTRYIGDDNFLFGYNLKGINIASPVAPTSGPSLVDLGESFTVHVPAGCADNYRQTKSWGRYNIIDDMPAPTIYAYDFDYCGGYAGESGEGINTPNAEFAIKITAEELKPYAGKPITSVQMNNSWYRNAYAFVYRASDGELLARQEMTPLEKHVWNSVRFAKPYVIDPADGDLLVGYGMLDRAQCAFSKYSHSNANYFREIGNEWTEGFYAGGGAWLISVTIEGEKMPVDARIREVQYNPVCTDGVLHVSGLLENCCMFGMTECEVGYTVTCEGAETPLASGTFKYTMDFVPHKSFAPFEADVPIGGMGNLIVELEVLTVNDKSDEVRCNGSGPLAVKARGKSEFTRNVVMEEGTGTWCCYCPRGIAGIEQMKAKYGDSFIAICVHQDVMAADESYESVLRLFPGLPGSIIDRKCDLMPDPNFSDLEAAYLQEVNIADCAVEATAEFAGTDDCFISVCTKTQFVEGADDTYKIACAVVEDGYGPYVQTSNYSPEELGLSCDFDKMMYDHVARSIYYAADDEGAGHIINSIPGKAQVHTLKFDTPTNIQDASKIRLVVMVMNNATGAIENAVEIPIGENTAIASVSEPAFNVTVNGLTVSVDGVSGSMALYNCSGIKIAQSTNGTLSAPTPGLYILVTPCSSTLLRL